MVSIRDIAARSGTSPATVSRVVNGSGYVAETTRARVLAAVEALGYLPNAGARRMRSGQSRLVGVLLPALDVPFFALLAHAIERALFAAGYQALVCCTDENPQAEARYIGTLLAQGVDGVIAASVLADGGQWERLRAAEVAVVAVDRDLPGLEAPRIGVDHHAGGAMMADHLIALGHRRIAILGAPAHSTPVLARVAGARTRMAAAGIAPLAVRLGPSHGFEPCRDLAQELLALRPTALLATTDIAAIGALHAAMAAGIAVPGGLSIIGFDDLPPARYVLPALTTIAQPLEAIGQEAVRQLVARMGGQRPPPLAPLPLRLVRRQTTAAP